MSTIRLLLADDHNVLRQGMAQVLDIQPDITVVAQASDGQQAVELARQHQPDVILMDINMPVLDGVAAAQIITGELPDTGIIILTMYRRDDYVFEAIKAGARGYLLKEVELDELLAAIRAVAGGEAVMDPAIASRVLSGLQTPAETQPPEQPERPDLPERDVEILRRVAEGWRNQEIADHLGISEKTVRNRLSLIYRQLQLENRTQAALYTRQHGLTQQQGLLPDDADADG